MTRQLPVFIARAPFRFPVPNSGTQKAQKGKANTPYIVGSRNFLKQVVEQRTDMIARTGRIELKTVPFEAWGDVDIADKRLLFVLPPPAIGEHVAIRLFFEQLHQQRGPAALGALGADAASDVYDGLGLFSAYPLWMPHAELSKFDMVFDLNDLPSRRNIEFWPVDMEAELYAPFGLTTPKAHEKTSKRSPDLPVVAIFPLATSPIRTLQPDLIRTLIDRLQPVARTMVVLNRWQNQSALLREALDARGVAVTYRDNLRTLSDVDRLLRRIDYGVFADSGPAHMTKLNGCPGAVLYSSAPAAPLLGHHRNLMAIQADYRGDHCQAPCGLAKLRRSADGRPGCMETLGVDAGALSELAADQADGELTRRFLLETPIPCARALAGDADTIAGRILQDLQQRLALPV